MISLEELTNTYNNIDVVKIELQKAEDVKKFQKFTDTLESRLVETAQHGHRRLIVEKYDICNFRPHYLKDPDCFIGRLSGYSQKVYDYLVDNNLDPKLELMCDGTMSYIGIVVEW